MYMGYCRMEGTKNELAACMREIEEYVNGEADGEISNREIKSFKNMIIDFVDWLYDMALLNENGELDYAGLEEICDTMINYKAN